LPSTVTNLLKKNSYTKGAVLKPYFGKRTFWQDFIDQEMKKCPPKIERESERVTTGEWGNDIIRGCMIYS
jgi:hypothetical protein